MKKIILSAAAVLALAGAAMADPAEGVWKTEPGDTGGYLHVTIKPCGANLCGTIRGAVDKDGQAVNDYEHRGKPIIKRMGINGGGSYSGGTIWAPDTDKTYSSKMSLSGNKLTVKGCVAGGLICRGQTWRRVN